MSGTILIRGGELHDGQGSPPITGDVLVAGDTIIAVGTFEQPDDAQLIDAAGCIVAPGFIDVHSHSDYTLLVDPRAVSSVLQGVTCEIVGNCGHGCAPFLNRKLGQIAVYGPVAEHEPPPASLGAYFETLGARRPAVNVMSLVPNGQLRLSCVGLEARPAEKAELQAMARELEAAMEQGGAGLSTGLEYAQESGATEDEIVALASIASRRGGIYATHTRDRDENALVAVEEAIRTAERAELPLQISHITPRSGMDVIDRCIDAALEARRRGNPVEFDMHTRTFGFTHLKNLVPASALEGSAAEVRARLADAGARAGLKRHRNLITRCGWHKVALARSRRSPEYCGKTFDEIGEALGRSPHDAALDILAAEADGLLYPMVILTTYTEEQLLRTYAAERCMIGSDATALAPDGPLADEVFYGAYGWASWFWRRVVRETRTMERSEAIHRLTGLPAAVFGLSGRGQLAAGMKADVVVFDPARFMEHATFEHPNRPATGILHLFVNGIHTVENGALTGNRGGVVLTRPVNRR